MEKYNLTDTLNEKYVPMFHIENSVRKWGGVQVEVIKIVCQEDDTEYMKHLFSLASLQQKIEKGLFIPTGIQLMETKEVLTSLLVEHKEFTDTVTSYQIDRILYKDMLSKIDDDFMILLKIYMYIHTHTYVYICIFMHVHVSFQKVKNLDSYVLL